MFFVALLQCDLVMPRTSYFPGATLEYTMRECPFTLTAADRLARSESGFRFGGDFGGESAHEELRPSPKEDRGSSWPILLKKSDATQSAKGLSVAHAASRLTSPTEWAGLDVRAYNYNFLWRLHPVAHPSTGS